MPRLVTEFEDGSVAKQNPSGDDSDRERGRVGGREGERDRKTYTPFSHTSYFSEYTPPPSVKTCEREAIR